MSLSPRSVVTCRTSTNLPDAGKPTCLYLSSRARQHFVFVETDATLFADPFPFFESRDTVASVTCAAEVRPPNRGYTGINVGVLSLKADPRVRTALRQLVELMAARPELDDQSELMRELAFFNTEEREFVDCVASADGFATGCCFNATYVVHAGGIGGTQGKISFLENAGLLLPCPVPTLIRSESDKLDMLARRTAVLGDTGDSDDSASAIHFDIATRAASALVSREAMHNALKAVIRSANPVRILVLGGSMTAGVGCEDGALILRACSWPSRFVRALSTFHPNKSFFIDHQASGGLTTAAALPLHASWLNTTSPALILIDFTINDTFDLQNTQLMLHTEALIHLLRRAAPESHPILVAGCALPECDRAVRVQRLVAATQRVAMISYFDAVAAVAEAEPGPSSVALDRALVQYWDYNRADEIMAPSGAARSWVAGPDWTHSRLHPYATTHKLLARLVANCWRASAFPLSPPAEVVPGAASYDAACAPTSFYSAWAPGRALATGGWRLFEDRPGKPGWIATGPGTLSFNLSFGPVPRLMLTYLKSYEGMRDVHMHFSGAPERVVTLSGLQDARGGLNVSQTFLHVFPTLSEWAFHPELGTAAVCGFNIHSGENRTLYLDVPDDGVVGKFKLISVSSC